MNEDMRAGLRERPWLGAFVEDDDEDLEAAERRWEEAVEEGVRRLEELGVEVYKRARTADNVETTMLLTSEPPIDIRRAR